MVKKYSKLDSKFLSALILVGLVTMFLVSAGCEVDTFLDDPSVVGRWERTPVVLPILDQLDIIEEGRADPPGLTPVLPSDLVYNPSEYIIGPGDLITFTIFELMVQGVESVQTRRVNEVGMVRLPEVGSIKVAGFSPSVLEKRIATNLEKKQKLKNPTVNVIVQENRQKTYSVIGEPQVAGTGIGTYTIPHANFRLLEAMALARGVPGRIKTIYVMRAPNPLPGDIQEETNAKAGKKDKPTPPMKTRIGRWAYIRGKWIKNNRIEAEDDFSDQANAMLQLARIIEVPYAKLLDGELRYNIIIHPGDVIRVPAPVIGNVYIGGQINRPGTYALPGDKDLTLKQLIFAAGNLAPIAIPERVDLIRRVSDNKEAIVRINLRAIFEGTEPDFYLKRNDTINVGTNFFATPLAVIRNGFRTTYGFGFVLDRNFDNKVFGNLPK